MQLGETISMWNEVRKGMYGVEMQMKGCRWERVKGCICREWS